MDPGAGAVPFGNFLAASSLLSGTRMLLTNCARFMPQQLLQRKVLIIGGVDLGSVDLEQPFWIDLSIQGPPSPEAARASLAKLRLAFDEISAWQPNWYFRPEIDAASGRFILLVVPLSVPIHEPVAFHVPAVPQQVVSAASLQQVPLDFGPNVWISR
jgi:hypothetical protein